MPGFWITDFGYLWLKLYRSRSKDYWKRPPGWCSVPAAPDQGSHQSSVWNAAHYCAAPEQSLVPKRERRAWSFRLFRSLKPAQSRSTVRRFCIIPRIRSTCWFHEQGKDFVELLGWTHNMETCMLLTQPLVLKLSIPVIYRGTVILVWSCLLTFLEVFAEAQAGDQGSDPTWLGHGISYCGHWGIETYCSIGTNQYVTYVTYVCI